MKLDQIAQRREQILVQAATQRIVLAQHFEALRTPLLVVDQGITVLRFIKHNPIVFLSISLLMTTLHLRPTGKWLQRAWLGWQVGRKLFKR